jgi:hypothetical protein
MKSNSVPARAGAFVLICLASATSALARNWLTNEPDVPPAISEDRAVLKDSAFNYGSRARVRIYRPDGVYDIRNGNYERVPWGHGDGDTETRDD